MNSIPGWWRENLWRNETKTEIKICDKYKEVKKAKKERTQ